ncbi:MAG: UvrD-helicase domain-containing protein [Bacteroidota bacterium]
MNTLTPYQKEALDFGKHISLTANAGSGKTFVLSKRFVEIALNANVALSKIVAITFTEKAAAELYKKISLEISHRLNESKNEIEIKKLQRIRRQLVSANISTIHSFCTNLLKEFSAEAGIDANFTPIDQTHAAELLENSIEEYFNANLLQTTENDLKKLIRVFGSSSVLKTQLKKVFNKRNTLIDLKHFYEKSDKEISEYYHNYFKSSFLELYQSGILEFVESVQRINSEVLGYSKPSDFALEIVRLLAIEKNESGLKEKIDWLNSVAKNLMTTTGTIRIQRYLLKESLSNYSKEMEVINNFKEYLDYFFIQENDDEKTLDLVRLSKVLLNVCLEIEEVYDQKKREISALDFDDLLMMAKNIVRNKNVLNVLAEKYEYIMIDEYQDTNEIQYNIFMPILSDLERGNLFVVGDDKQSIYMFRDAELKIFSQTKKVISGVSSEASLLNLPHSFRVAPKLALFINTVFRNLFANADEKYNEVAFNDLISARTDTDTGAVEILIGEDEAEQIAQRIILLLSTNEGLLPGDIAILTRKRDAFASLEQAFVKYNLPYVIVGGKGFYQQQTIMDVYNFMSFLLDSKNDIALLSILRSPFYSLPDTVLYNVSLSDGDCFFDRLQNAVSKNESLKEIVDSLQKFKKLIDEILLPELVLSILNETGYWTVISAKKNAKQEIANLEKLINLASDYSKLSYSTLYDFVLFLKESISIFGDEGQAALNLGDDSIKIMTIHQSKGLEFKHLFVYKCSVDLQVDIVKSRQIIIDKDFGLLTKIPFKENYFGEYAAPSIAGLYNFTSYRKNLAENKRLFYVALTRAIDGLYITADITKYKRNSFIGLLASALDIDFEEEQLSLNGEVQFMKDASHNYELYIENMSVDIPIVRSIDLPVEQYTLKEETRADNHSFILDKFHDSEKNEIISATKIAIFNQCPQKYHLTYNLGFTKLLSIFGNEFENPNKRSGDDAEDSGNLPPNLKGSVIHKILEENIPAELLEQKIKEFILAEKSEFNMSSLNKTIAEIMHTVQSFYNSEIYREIISFAEYENEFQIYIKEQDYFLFGIIDKVIFTDDKLIIIDYKSDQVLKNRIADKIQNYRVQLLFYAYSLSKYYSSKKFEIRLVLLNQPESSYIELLDPVEIKNFRSVLSNYVKMIRENNYPKNLSHCNRCHFFINQNCVGK